MNYLLNNGWYCTKCVYSQLYLVNYCVHWKGQQWPMYPFLRLQGLPSSRSSSRLMNRRCEWSLNRVCFVLQYKPIITDITVCRKTSHRTNCTNFSTRTHGVNCSYFGSQLPWLQSLIVINRFVSTSFWCFTTEQRDFHRNSTSFNRTVIDKP